MNKRVAKRRVSPVCYSFSLTSFSLRFSSRLSSNTTEALSRNSFFQLRSRLGWMLFSAARVLRSFYPLSNSFTRSDLNLALKFLLCLDMAMNPFSHTEYSISDSLKTVRKSVLIYEIIIFRVYLEVLIFFS